MNLREIHLSAPELRQESPSPVWGGGMLLGVSSSGRTMKMMAMMSSAVMVAVKGDLQPGREAKLLVLGSFRLDRMGGLPPQAAAAGPVRPSDGCLRGGGGSKSGTADPERAADTNI